MIVVRNSFVAKPGMAGKLAAHMKEMTAAVSSARRLVWLAIRRSPGEIAHLCPRVTGVR